MADLTADARSRGATLVLFPEAFVSGYPRGLDFGAVVGGRSEAGRDDFRRYWESAVDVPGPAVDVLSKVARQNSVHLVVGVIERERGTLYCGVLFFAPDGRLLGKRRKVMPTGSERLIWGFGDGSTLQVYDTALGRIGAVICWENYMPLLRTAMYAKSIELYCAPTADGRETWAVSMRHIAVEGRCFVLSCNQFSRRRDFPPDYKRRSAMIQRLCSPAAEAASWTPSASSWPGRVMKAKLSCWPRLTVVRSRAASTTWTWWGITRGRIFSPCR